MRNRPLLLVGIAATVVLVAGFGVWWLFFSDDAPDAVDIAAANEQLDLDLAEADNGDETAATTAPDPEPAAPIGIDRVWTVDNTLGDFDFDSASGSFAGFRVDEELTVGSTTAVGRTSAVTGTVTVDGGVLTAADLTVELGGIVSNDSRRERAIREALDTDQFPTATFVLAAPVELPDDLAAGAAVPVEATGELTIHGVTNAATFTLDALVRDDGIAVVTGSAPVVFADYGVSAPSAPVVVSVDDEGIIELQLLLT